jgi:Ca2+-transporting ATPase
MIEAPHAATADAVVDALGIRVDRGVAASEVASRRASYGANRLPEPPPINIAALIARQFKNIIILLLAVAAAISFFTGDPIDGAAITVVLVLNAIIGFVTEFQAGRALEALRKQMHVMARVRRDGHEIEVPAEDLVAGDVVLLGAGDRIPADLRVIEASRLRAEESALTGESRTVEKSPHPVPAAAPVAERSSMLFLGTAVSAGRAVGIVTAVGETTELGKIGRLVSDVADDVTPLQKQLDVLGRRLVYIVLVIAAVVTVAGLVRGDNIWLMLSIGISLAVAAVPEALPAVTTFILAFGVLRMARQRAIVRRLTAVETLGSTTVICSDKTGTLTMNRMTVTEVWPDGESASAIEVMVLCNDASPADGDAPPIGDPTEVALLDYGAANGVDIGAMRRQHPRAGEHPFDSVTKRMITIHRDGSRFLWLLKGAPSVVLDACAGGDRAASIAGNDRMASAGLRVLALARKQTDTLDAPAENGFEFVGLIGMRDPPREGAAAAIATAREAGIRVIMLTGDQLETARAIAAELGFGDGKPAVMHASELTESLDHVVGRVDAFARVSPEDKYRIVETLQNRGEVVAVTGDGVNDAPALKKSDVGIAMGERGTEVAKEAADIVLADDNFSTIVVAVEGGRTIYANIQKFVHLMLSHNLAEIITIFAAILAGWPLPLLPLHILWLNLVTDVFPAFALALEPAAPGIMQNPPRRRSETLLNRPLAILVGWQALLLGTLALLAYRWALDEYGEGSHARTVALFALVGVQMGQTFNCRSRTRSAFSGLMRNPHIWFAMGTVLLLQLFAVYIAPLRAILGLTIPNMQDWIVLAITFVVPVIVVEVQKAVARALPVRGRASS